ncbi:leucine-rich repeat receptor-like protein kinase family protein [Striga asiatica]|uniref:Leucine-rich repeat receptor-like protein kinase family protein n=1 Tax=Striga asiatica TaxID=4170 RepID=A0A5A7PSV5_STRAF|nr:leucine-rich repeat receptor-like protein kinase family protein [Striga asiatica]
MFVCSVKVRNMEKVCNVFIFVILMLQPLSSIYADDVNKEAQVLVDIKNLLNGTEDCMQNWDQNGNPCKFSNIVCRSGFVYWINLSENCMELTGLLDDIAEGLADLTYLKALYVIFKHKFLNNNALTGQIPSTLTNIRSLHILLLNNNALTGEILWTLTNITSLEILDLSNNNLTGHSM